MRLRGSSAEESWCSGAIPADETLDTNIGIDADFTSDFG